MSVPPLTSGKYAFIESDNGPYNGATAWLVTHMFKAQGYHCVKFYYHMYGSDVRELDMFYRVSEIRNECSTTYANLYMYVWDSGGMEEMLPIRASAPPPPHFVCAPQNCIIM